MQIKKGRFIHMEFKEVVLKNRSYRGYDETRKITREELVDLVDCARLTPSAMNGQPFSYYLAWEKEQVDTIQGLTKWAAALPHLNLPYEGKRPTGYIVICQNKEVSENLQQYRTDLGIVAQTICLGAVAKGLGCCMIGNFNGADMQSALGLSEQFFPLLAVAVGKPDETIVIKEIEKGEPTKYYRDENDVHYVPKRKLEDILL